jgi:hypothetical protein
LKQAREVEKSGGMKTKKGERDKTLGGIYFHLVKAGCDEATVKLIWPVKDWSTIKKKRKE